MRVPARLFEASGPGADVLETHISTVAFDGDIVHKRKKEVRFPFIDLSTPERREAICRREVELNRRFSPDVYLGVEEVVDDDGVVVDHAVRMRRMPADRRLSTLARGTADIGSCLRQIARLIAIAHAEGLTNAEISSVATTSALLRLWHQNLVELEPFAPEPLDRGTLAEIGTLADRYLTGRARLLEDRIRRGCVVDGHGDLLADDIYCLDDGPRVLDCLEFDDRLRWGDVLYDVGFLAMDLERLGRPDLAQAFMAWYREFSAETHPESLAHHYVAYRALVRSKISCLRGSSADHDEARAYLAQCARHLQSGRLRLVLIGGLPGSGKSTARDGAGRRARLAGVAFGRAPEGTRGPRVSDSGRSPVQGGAVLPSDNTKRPTPHSSIEQGSCSRRADPPSSTRRSRAHRGTTARPPLRERRARTCSSCGAPCPRASLPIVSVNERPAERTHRMPTRRSAGRWRPSSTNGRTRPRSTRGRPARSSLHRSPSSSRPPYATDGLATQRKRARQRAIDVTLE